jgi:hypothetical protein
MATTLDNLTDHQIHTLLREAETAGDKSMACDCAVALNPGYDAGFGPKDVAAARRRIVAAINDAEAQAETE